LNRPCTLHHSQSYSTRLWKDCAKALWHFTRYKFDQRLLPNIIRIRKLFFYRNGNCYRVL